MKTSSLTFLLLLLTVGAWAQALPKPMSHDELLRRLAERRGTNHLAGTPLIPAGTTLGQPGSGALAPSGTPLPAGPAGPGTVPFSSSTLVSGNGGAGTGSPDETIPPGTINFQGVDVNQVLDVYAQLVNRTLLRAQLPQASIVLKTQTPLTKSEAIAALKAVLALNNIAVIDVGDKFVKVVPVEMAGASAAVIDRSSATNLPELGSYVTHVVQLKYIKPSVMMPIIQPFAKLQNSVLPIDDNGILVLRDFAENVKRMLEMIEQVDVSVPEEYISEVIPIKYAQAEDIAGALNSLGGNGGSSVTSFGSGGNGSSISGLHGPTGGGGFGGGGGGISGLGGSTSGGYGNGSSNFGQNRTLGGATPNGTPSSGSSFQSRLNSIINKAAGGQQDQIQVFGQAKIIADSRSNSLLIFATRADMIHIKHVIDQLDVLLAQVLIEAVIMDVSLDKAFSFGVSAAQNPKSFSPSTPVIGGGGFNNGQPFANFLSSNANYFANGSNVTSSLGNGFSYFGNIGPTWDVAMQALASDTSASVIQRPRIQTSQAKEAQFFVGETVPYITSSYYGGVGYGNNSSYSQLSVGIELDITPFINPDGLVVMDVQQEIDDIVSSTASNGDLAPTTSKRTLNSEIAVKDKDTIILGGFVKSQVSRSRSGVPILEDIPLLGSLFSQKSSNKDREELLVLMRPTVLRSPDQADTETLREERRLPGVSAAASDDAEYERELINAQKKAEKARAKKTGQYDGFYNAESNQVDSVNLPTSTQAVYPPTQPPQQPVPMSNEDQIKAQQALQEKLNILNSADTNSNK